MVITGDEYLKRIDALNNEVWIHGERVKGKITEHPAFKGVLQSKAALYDLQHDPDLTNLLTVQPQDSTDKIGFSFHQPKTIEDLKKERRLQEFGQKRMPALWGECPITSIPALWLWHRPATYSAKTSLCLGRT